MARCARAPPSVQCAVQSACTQRRAHARNPRYMCTPRSPRTAMQPAPRDSRLPHVEPAPAARSTVRTVVSLSQKENKKAKQRPRPHRKRIYSNKSKKEGRVRKNILPKFLRQTAFPSEIMIQKEFQKRKHPLFVTLLWRTPNPSRNDAECQTTRGQVCVAPSTPK